MLSNTTGRSLRFAENDAAGKTALNMSFSSLVINGSQDGSNAITSHPRKLAGTKRLSGWKATACLKR